MAEPQKTTVAAGDNTPLPASIGTASQQPDGTIILTLRAEQDNGGVGDAQFRYAPSDPDYAMIKAHVGPIPPNGSVQVKPFPTR